jgi:glutamyl-tRNA reductase
MPLYLIGLNHQTAPVGLRERVAFDAGALPHALAELRALPGVTEAALLSTCNRTELYAVADDHAPISHWLARHADAGHDLEAYLYRHHDGDAVRHLFRVAAGLDSLVLGEPQILGQVKTAWAEARAAGSLGHQLDRLFQHAFVTAKRARSETRIGANPVSVASVAVRLAEDSFARLRDVTVLLIGAGDTIALVARHVAEARCKRLLVANRTLPHAQAIASRHNGYALPLAELDHHLAEADIVFTATASREPILHRPQVEAALARRRHRPMLLLDLAVPRDIAADVGELRDVFLYAVDDLERAIEDNRRSRRQAAEAAEEIIALQVVHYREALDAATRQGPLKQLRADGERIRDHLLDEARHELDLGHDPGEVMQKLAHQLTNQLLHAPTAALREAAQQGDLDLLGAAERLLQRHRPRGHDDTGTAG